MAAMREACWVGVGAPRAGGSSAFSEAQSTDETEGGDVPALGDRYGTSGDWLATGAQG